LPDDVVGKGAFGERINVDERLDHAKPWSPRRLERR